MADFTNKLEGRGESSKSCLLSLDSDSFNMEKEQSNATPDLLS